MNPNQDEAFSPFTGEVDAEPMEEEPVVLAVSRPQHRRNQGRVMTENFNFTSSTDPSKSSEARERRHAAISILNDSELLMFHALANNESIPQARRRFNHHLIGIQPPKSRPLAIHDLSHPRPQNHSQHIYLNHQPQPSPNEGNSGNNRPGYATQEQTPTMIDIIEINGGWEARLESEGGPSRVGSITPGRGIKRGEEASPGSSSANRRGRV